VEFRWVALIALWTLIAGPVLGTPQVRRAPSPERSAVRTAKAVPAKAPARASDRTFLAK
jgi:hypothetical protein